MKVNKFDNMQFVNTNVDVVNQDTTQINGSEAERLRSQLEAGMTLTDITDFLIKEDMML
jgi:Ni2+-binding GTPase involved in maturation of urease and hydrogenase